MELCGGAVECRSVVGSGILGNQPAPLGATATLHGPWVPYQCHLYSADRKKGQDALFLLLRSYLKGRVTQKQIFHSLRHSLNGCKGRGGGQAEVKRQELHSGLPDGCRSPNSYLIFYCFPGLLSTGRWMGNEAART